MTAQAGSGVLREMFVVVAFAVTGLLLAVAAVFNPWHFGTAGTRRTAVVEMNAPGGTADRGELAAPGRR